MAQARTKLPKFKKDPDAAEEKFEKGAQGPEEQEEVLATKTKGTSGRPMSMKDYVGSLKMRAAGQANRAKAMIIARRGRG